MARRRSLAASIAQMQREAARAQAQRVRAQQAAQREAERARAAYKRAKNVEEKERKRLYQESRIADVAASNEDLELRVQALASLLEDTLSVDDHISFDSLKVPVVLPTWQHQHLEAPRPAPQWGQFAPPAPTGLGKVFGKSKYEQAVADAQAKYQQSLARHAADEHARMNALAQAQSAFAAEVQARKAEAAKQHAEVDAFRVEYEAGDPDAIISYYDMVLQRSSYPENFPQNFKVAYVPESRQIVVEYELPAVDVIPHVKAFRYVKSTDTINETARPATQVKSIYASAIAQIALRTLHELFEADRGRHLDVIVFNGMVDTVDRGSGQKVRPCLITLRTTRDVFANLDLSKVDPPTCLKHLSAGVSKNPAELAPVRPVLEFDMVDARFVEESDALSLVDSRPNLMELTPNEFESLIQNLFTKMGLEARQTRPSRDGGVDCVAFDPRPIFGGKVVIQAKRYKNTVGVSAVRDLFGTLTNEGASKGILVTTSGYGQASFDFAQNKPIELIDGANLLYLLNEHADIQAKILPPNDWRDPA
ncbi:restriction endonuclease [Nonomuraea wenchangensis]|uniref:restriction endonuclease n=1 Tax=Nonomuraea wenchangensis TaxID=568860 RepID=UPI0033C18F87